MLSTALFTVLAASLAAAALVVALFAYRASAKSLSQTLELAKWTRANNAKSVTLKRMAEVEASLTDLTDSYDSLLKQHKRLRSRYSMRKNREVANSDDTDLHSETDKTQLRLKAKAQGLI